jgi:hypothetical protein
VQPLQELKTWRLTKHPPCDPALCFKTASFKLKSQGVRKPTPCGLQNSQVLLLACFEIITENRRTT